MSDTSALQPGQFEHILFHYGAAHSIVQVRRDIAEKLAPGYVGREIILPGQLVRIVSVRLEDDLGYSGVRGRVIAVCETVSGLQHIPFKPRMEYK